MLCRGGDVEACRSKSCRPSSIDCRDVQRGAGSFAVTRPFTSSSYVVARHKAETCQLALALEYLMYSRYDLIAYDPASFQARSSTSAPPFQAMNDQRTTALAMTQGAA